MDSFVALGLILNYAKSPPFLSFRSEVPCFHHRLTLAMTEFLNSQPEKVTGRRRLRFLVKPFLFLLRASQRHLLELFRDSERSLVIRAVQ